MFSYKYNEGKFASTNTLDIDQLIGDIYKLDLSTKISHMNSNIDGSKFDVEIFFTEDLLDAEKVILNNAIRDYTNVKYSNYFIKMSDSKPVASNGGDFISGSWVVRQINNISANQNLVSLENNRFTLQPGNYLLNINAISNGVKNNQIRLFDVTNAQSVDVSLNGYSTDTNNLVSLNTNINIETATTYEIHHMCENSQLNWGFGKATGFGESEIYLTVVLQTII